MEAISSCYDQQQQHHKTLFSFHENFPPKANSSMELTLNQRDDEEIEMGLMMKMTK